LTHKRFRGLFIFANRSKYNQLKIASRNPKPHANSGGRLLMSGRSLGRSDWNTALVRARMSGPPPATPILSARALAPQAIGRILGSTLIPIIAPSDERRCRRAARPMTLPPIPPPAAL
jgi:hypothetical protein